MDNDEFIENKYNNYLTNLNKKNFSKDVLIERLKLIDWNSPLIKRGKLCLRNPDCSPDCQGSDCS